MIRVLFFNYSSDIGGAEASLLTLINHLDKQYIECSMLTCGSGLLESSASEHGIKVYKAKPQMVFGMWKRDSILKILLLHPFSMIDILKQTYEIRKIVKKISPDILHCNNPKSCILGVFSTIGLKIRIVWHMRDVFKSGGFDYRLFAFFAKVKKPNVVAISRFVYKSMPQSLSRNSRIIYNGVSLLPAIRGREKIRDELGIQLNAKVILCAGRLVSWKGPDEVISAMIPFLKSADYHLLFAGTASYGSADYLNSLKIECIRKGVSGRVHFLGFRSDMGDVMAASDVLILASRNEPFGRVLAEAQLAGLPCAAYNEGGIPEIIEDKITGLLADAGNIDSLCLKAIKFLEDPVTMRIMIQRAQLFALQKWSPSISAAAISDLYQGMANKNSR